MFSQVIFTANEAQSPIDAKEILKYLDDDGMAKRRMHDAAEFIHKFVHSCKMYGINANVLVIPLPQVLTSTMIEDMEQIILEPELPPVIIIGVSRVRNVSSVPGEWISKKDSSNFKFPDSLKIRGQSFELKSLAEHYGSSFGGCHWVAYSFVDGSWFKCDDAIISKTTKMHIMKKVKPSILLYEVNQ